MGQALRQAQDGPFDVEKKKLRFSIILLTGLVLFCILYMLREAVSPPKKRRTANKGISQPGRQGGEEMRVMISSSQIALVSLFYSF